jgi:hypothetical protein
MKIRQNRLDTYTKNALPLLFSKYKFKSCVHDIITALVDNEFYVFTFSNETMNLRHVFVTFCVKKNGGNRVFICLFLEM